MYNESSTDVTSLPSNTSSVTNAPTVTFENITFSDGTMISLESTDVVVLVGPNNAGKSLALRELEMHVGSASATKVVRSTHLSKIGTAEEFSVYFEKHVKVKDGMPYRTYYGYGFSFGVNSPSDVSGQWPNDLGIIRPFFCRRILTENRITDSDPAAAIAILEEPASHPIHMLYSDDQLEYRLSDYFRQAFGEDLILHRAGGSVLPLLVGERLTPRTGEDRISNTYCERLLENTVPLSDQGDGMRSFASVILHLLAPITPSILLLDEPEAFLHPPQARLLGEIIATEKSSRAQLFVATHSPDVLHGLINVAPEHLRVLRIQRDGNINRIKELDKGQVKEISTDPLMKYSSVMSGVFYERVIICESDADCMFYNSLLDLPQVHGDRQPDVLFVHANGKNRMAALAKALTALDVPVDIIADIDVLSDDTVLRRIIEALGGDWTAIKSDVQAVKTAIEQHKPWLNASEIKKGIGKILENVPMTGQFPKPLRSEINQVFRKASPWDAIKDAGEAALPSGQATQQFQNLQTQCKRMGMWIVPVGELEGFCKSVGRHGPQWVQQVIENRDLSNDPELERAREFVHEVWRDGGGLSQNDVQDAPPAA